MGQYHKVYNVDRKEFIHAHDINNGLKLLEQIGFPMSTSTALFLLLANSNGRGGGDVKPHPFVGRWAGDRIVIQGDYAEEDDQAFIPEEQRDEFANISADVLDMLRTTVGDDE